MMRPRGGLARVLYEKIHTDARLQSMDKEQWYCIDDNRMKAYSEENWSKFIPLDLDDSTQSFLDQCLENSDNTFWQLWLTTASSILSWFLAPTSINGLLGRGSMQVFSAPQFQTLIGWDHEVWAKYDRLLDIGAGDGETTKKSMEQCFKEVYATEMSTTMKWSLEKKGFKVLNETSWAESGIHFDVISCLNVLDRCDKPLSLLSSIATALKPGGIAVVSFVIPFKPYVEFESETNQPTEMLPITGENFEEEVHNFIEKVLKPNGWEVIRWTRLPYLCEGDIKQAFYWLNDAVFVIRRR